MIGWKLLAAASFIAGCLVAAPPAYIAGDLLGGWEAVAQAELKREISDLEAALGAAHQDLNAQRIAAEQNRLAAEENGRAAVEAQERINDYEAELQARGPDARCLLNDADRQRLQSFRRRGFPDPPIAPGKSDLP